MHIKGSQICLKIEGCSDNCMFGMHVDRSSRQAYLDENDLGESDEDEDRGNITL